MSKAAELAALIGSQSALSNRNLIINGAMQVAQRGTSGTTNTGYNSVDRFATQAIATDNLAMTLTQETDSPAGFSNSLKVTVTTAESALASDEFFSVQHRIEAQNLQSLQYGASSAKSVTLSFYVKSTTTGTYTVALQQIDGTRVITSTYAISSANTWEKKTLTFTGDASGSFANDNGEGLRIYWFLAAGSDYTSVDSTSWSAYADNKVAYGHAVNIIDSTSKTWQITGVQLEVGEQATPFEHRSFGDELARCRRYCQVFRAEDAQGAFVNLTGWDTNSAYGAMPLPVHMRAAPSFTRDAGNDDFLILSAGSNFTPNNVTTNGLHKDHIEVQISSDGNLVAGRSYWGRISDNTNGKITLSAEL